MIRGMVLFQQGIQNVDIPMAVVGQEQQYHLVDNPPLILLYCKVARACVCLQLLLSTEEH